MITFTLAKITAFESTQQEVYKLIRNGKCLLDDLSKRLKTQIWKVKSAQFIRKRNRSSDCYWRENEDQTTDIVRLKMILKEYQIFKEHQ